MLDDDTAKEIEDLKALKELSNEDLSKKIAAPGSRAVELYGPAEYLSRRVSTPRWIIWTGLILAFLGTLFAAIAALPVIQNWFAAPVSQPVNTDSSSPPRKLP